MFYVMNCDLVSMGSSLSMTYLVRIRGISKAGPTEYMDGASSTTKNASIIEFASEARCISPKAGKSQIGSYLVIHIDHSIVYLRLASRA